MSEQNPLVRDRDVDFLLYEVLHVEELTELDAFAEHSKETFDLYLSSVRRLARDVLYPAYRPMDEAPPVFRDGKITTHAAMKPIYRALVELGVISATRPSDVGGAHLPLTVAVLAHAYLMAANLSAYGYAGLTNGAAHLIEAFGDDALKRDVMTKLYAGEWTGTMALTEPQAGSSLADVKTKATLRADGTYAITGSKIFISGGDHDLTENVVNMTLARIDGAPPGVKGVSLFAVPKRRVESGVLVDNDLHVAGVIHKIGWRGLPSLALSFGDEGDCRGFLVGKPNEGLRYMFQMMNEARIMVGVNGVATASVAYHESLAYARMRLQGRPLANKDPKRPPVAIIEHADVKRMLLRQKAIVEGGLALVAFVSHEGDLAEHAKTEEERRYHRLLLDALTPIAKSFPAEWGFESNALAVQIHGGYGYSSEQLPESWLRDQKLNSIHEGTTGVQAMDLLGRRIVAEGGAPLRLLREAMSITSSRAAASDLDATWGESLNAAVTEASEVTMRLGAIGAGGDAESMLVHATDYLAMMSILVVAWLWLEQATIAKRALANAAAHDHDFYEGKIAACDYWFATELPKTRALAELCRSNERSYAAMKDAWF